VRFSTLQEHQSKQWESSSNFLTFKNEKIISEGENKSSSTFVNITLAPYTTWKFKITEVP